MTGALLVIVHYRLPAPLSFKGPRRLRQNYKPHIKRPDGDNLEKFLNDSLTGLIWDDDARIAWLLRSKTITSDKVGSTIVYAKEISEVMTNYNELLESIHENIQIHELESEPM